MLNIASITLVATALEPKSKEKEEEGEEGEILSDEDDKVEGVA